MEPQTIMLPTPGGTLERYTLTGAPAGVPDASDVRAVRRAYSAAHVVTDPLAPWAPGDPAPIDWEATLAFREYLFSLGLGVAEAMDTAQRGQGLDAGMAMRLAEETAALARSRGGGDVCAGCNTDALAPGTDVSLDDIVAAYRDQVDRVARAGAVPVVMASRHLARMATGPEDYRRVYDRVLAGLDGPVILHWLGEVFDPSLRGYWGSEAVSTAMDICLEVIDRHRDVVDGIKISLLEKAHEIEMRRRLPDGVRMYTGDDFNYPELIAGDGEYYSHALLGIFDPIAPAASAALGRLAAGDQDGFRRVLDPTVPLARHVFEKPTPYYKTGVVLLAYLNGHQGHFVMVGGMQGMRSLQHFAELFRLADGAGVLTDPERAVTRMRRLLHLYGLEG